MFGLLYKTIKPSYKSLQTRVHQTFLAPAQDSNVFQDWWRWAVWASKMARKGWTHWWSSWHGWSGSSATAVSLMVANQDQLVLQATLWKMAKAKALGELLQWGECVVVQFFKGAIVTETNPSHGFAMQLDHYFYLLIQQHAVILHVWEKMKTFMLVWKSKKRVPSVALFVQRKTGPFSKMLWMLSWAQHTSARCVHKWLE